MNLNVPDLRRVFKEVFNSFPKLERLNFKIQDISDNGIKLGDKFGGKYFVPLDVSELAMSNLKSLTIGVDSAVQDMLFYMEGQNLSKFDIEELTLTGK